jgi:hypothetical protein
MLPSPLDSLRERAMTDADLRARLAADPVGTLHAAGVDLPADLPIRVIELPMTATRTDTPLAVSAAGEQLLVLPYLDEHDELSDDALVGATGGIASWEVVGIFRQWLGGIGGPLGAPGTFGERP